MAGGPDAADAFAHGWGSVSPVLTPLDQAVSDAVMYGRSVVHQTDIFGIEWKSEGNRHWTDLGDGSRLVVTVSDKSPMQVAYEELKARGCDCPGCMERNLGPRTAREHDTTANFMRASDAAARCADDDKRWGALA